MAPHEDVASGRYMQAEFAADLAQVHKGEGSDEYRDPVEFYRRTCITAGMEDLLVGALQRVAGEDGDPVVELQTEFGGGKTHAMLALYHLFGGADATALEGVAPVLADAGVSAPPEARRAVLVGTALSPAEVNRKEDGTAVRTMWGELAWQLGGRELFRLVADSDAEGVSPGSDVLAAVFRKCGPCVILIDEWVAYARQLHDRTGLPAGTFDAQTSFAHALTEAAARVPGTLVVASIPASKSEVGGRAGARALEVLERVFARVGKPWRPAGGDEGVEIARRRLFAPIAGEACALRDATLDAFLKMYSDNAADFPRACRDGDYRAEMARAYPIHPELFHRLHDDWSALDTFQRTRGVLRLLARVIHRLWQDDDRAPMILPASVPLDDRAVKSELTRHLPEPWDAILDKDVDGPDSTPLEIDGQVTNLGGHAAAQRVARTLFIGTAPGAGAPAPGIGAARILLGCAQPGAPLGAFADALRRVGDRGQNVHRDGGRYWISTRPNLNRAAAARAAQLLREPEELYPEIVARLRSDKARGPFACVHACPASPADVPDEPEARLVVFGPELTHEVNSDSSAARAAALGFIEQRGGAPRTYRNALVFLAPGGKELEGLLEATASYLAWRQIHESRETTELDAFQKNQAATKAQELDKAVDLRIGQTWTHVLAPTRRGPTEDLHWDEARVSGTGPLAVRVAEKLERNEQLLTSMGGVRLRMELDRHLWSDADHVSFGDLCAWFPRYLYLPRLADQGVLANAVIDGCSHPQLDESFASADGFDASNGGYLGLMVCEEPALTPSTVLVKPEVARLRGIVSRAVPTAESPAAGARQDSSTFAGSVDLRGLQIDEQLGAIADEVLRHLAALPGASIKATLELRVELPEGAPADVVRIVTENARALGFRHVSFE